MYLLKKMIEIEPQARAGTPVSIPDLRAAAGLKSEEFDRALIRLSDSRIVVLKRAIPSPGINERGNMLVVGDWVFSGVMVHPDVDESFFVGIVKIDQLRPPITLEKSPDVDPMPKIKKSRKPGGGRKPVPAHLKRERFKMIRLPMWIQDWLKGQPDAGKLVEQAIIEKYGLKPPEGAKEGDDDEIRHI